MPRDYRLLYRAEDISAKVSELGASIAPWLFSSQESTGHDVIAIPLLRGGIIFFADLVRTLPASVIVSPSRANAYRANDKTQSITVSLEESLIKGRAVLLIDEICDSGGTLEHVSRRCTELGAADVKHAVLIKREADGEFEPTWVGFRYRGSEWLVGYGMDDNDRYRNLPAIYTLEKK